MSTEGTEISRRILCVFSVFSVPPCQIGKDFRVSSTDGHGAAHPQPKSWRFFASSRLRSTTKTPRITKSFRSVEKFFQLARILGLVVRTSVLLTGKLLAARKEFYPGFPGSARFQRARCPTPRGTLEACAPPRTPRLCGEAFGLRLHCSVFICVHRWFHFVQ